MIKHSRLVGDLKQELELAMAQAVGEHRVGGGASMKSWLIGAMQLATQRIVVRLNAKMRGKGWKRRPLHSIALSSEPSVVAENKEVNELLLRAINSIELPGRRDLQERNRRIFIDMHGLGDGVRKTPPEVASRHGISVSLVHRVSKAFKERLAVHPLILPLAPSNAYKKPRK